MTILAHINLSVCDVPDTIKKNTVINSKSFYFCTRTNIELQMELDALKIVIVDEEAKERETIRFLLDKMPFVKIEGEADSVNTALPLIIQTRPDLVLLDLKLPGQDGFALLDELNKLEFHSHIIFITSHYDYVQKAIRYRPFDFLIKPIHTDELRTSLHKVLMHKQDHHIAPNDLKNRQQDSNRKICFKTRSGFMMVDPLNLAWVQADWNYSIFVHINQIRETISMNIGKVENMLPSNQFYRLDRSTIINLNYLQKIDFKSRTCFMDFNGNEKTFKITPKRIKALRIALDRS